MIQRLVLPFIFDHPSGIIFIRSTADEISWKKRNPNQATDNHNT